MDLNVRIAVITFSLVHNIHIYSMSVTVLATSYKRYWLIQEQHFMFKAVCEHYF